MFVYPMICVLSSAKISMICLFEYNMMIFLVSVIFDLDWHDQLINHIVFSKSFRLRNVISVD